MRIFFLAKRCGIIFTDYKNSDLVYVSLPAFQSVKEKSFDTTLMESGICFQTVLLGLSDGLACCNCSLSPFLPKTCSDVFLTRLSRGSPYTVMGASGLAFMHNTLALEMHKFRPVCISLTGLMLEQPLSSIIKYFSNYQTN